MHGAFAGSWSPCVRAPAVSPSRRRLSRVPARARCLGRAVCGSAGLILAVDSVALAPCPAPFVSCFPRGPRCQGPSVRVSGPGGPSGGCGRGASGPGGHPCLGLLRYWASSSPPTRPPLVTRVAQLSSCWRPGLGRRSLRGDGRCGEVTAALALLTVLLGCRFVSRVFVVPDHPHLLLSASGVSVPGSAPP